MIETDHGRTAQEEKSLALTAYYSDSYFTRRQLFSQAAQIHRIHSLKPKRILEIGKGNGFVAEFLLKAGYDVVTFDVNPSLVPDVVGSVLELTKYFSKGEFDLIVCAEVLEHLPFEHLSGILDQMSAISSKYVYVTLPQSGRVLFDFHFELKVPFISFIERSLSMRLRTGRLPKEHHWEVGSSAKTRKRELVKIFMRNFTIQLYAEEPANTYHQHIVLKRR